MKILLFIVYAIVLSAGLARRGVSSTSMSSATTAANPPKRLLIVGATGGTGRELVAQALARGYSVRALVRDRSKFKVEHPELEVMQGDVLNYASVERALRDQDAVICALGHKRFFYPARILSEGTQNLLRAMQTQGVPRLVCETALGLGNSAGRMGLCYTFIIIPLILPLYFWDKTRQERLIAASKTEWVIVRPGALTNGVRRGTYRHGRNVGSFIWTVRISRADAADFMLNQLIDNTYLRAAPSVCC
jgi:putative NADH-flavin reductase